MKRSAPMKRSAFKRKLPERQPREERQVFAGGVDIDKVHWGRYGSNEVNAPQEKENPVRSEAYRRLVAALPCAVCKIQGYSQACHGDEGKGLSLKSCDLTCWPGCGPHGNEPGCHWLMGTSGRLSRDERRELEQVFAARTRLALLVQAQDDPHTAKVLRSVGLLP